MLQVTRVATGAIDGGAIVAGLGLDVLVFPRYVRNRAVHTWYMRQPRRVHVFEVNMTANPNPNPNPNPIPGHSIGMHPSTYMWAFGRLGNERPHVLYSLS